MYIYICSKKPLFLYKPNPELFDPETVAYALSNIPRFAGHCKPYWSVAAHSLLVRAIAPEDAKSLALLHDVAEMITGDIPRPVKEEIDSEKLRYIEEKATHAACKYYGVDFCDFKARELVRQADNQALKWEMAWFFGRGDKTTHLEKWAELCCGPRWYDREAQREAFEKALFELAESNKQKR